MPILCPFSGPPNGRRLSDTWKVEEEKDEEKGPSIIASSVGERSSVEYNLTAEGKKNI